MIANNLLKLKLGVSRKLAQERTIMDADTKKRQLQQAGLSVRQLRMRITCDDPLHRGMKKIKLSGKELAKLPPNLFKITELEVLDLSPEREACLFYHLVEIPREISNLRNLTVLALDTNRLMEVPEELCQLTALERLALSNNQLSHLPLSLPSLTNLRSLYCSNNRFEYLPSNVCQLQSLSFLDFSDNFITSLPGEDIAAMQSLECLVLSYNRIQILPESICDLKALQMLWLCGNCLTELPRGLGRLVNLDWSHLMLTSALDDNPLKHPPLFVAKQGPEAIEKYFSLEQSNRDKAKEAKVIPKIIK